MHDTVLPITILGVVAIFNVMNRKKQKRKTWSKQWLRDRQKYSHMSLLKHLNENNPDDYRNFLRMNDVCFQNVLQAVTPFIIKKDTLMRESISPEQRLIATLRYLATGRSLQDLKFSTGISPQSLGKIIPETCKAIIMALQQEYIKVQSIFCMLMYSYMFIHCIDLFSNLLSVTQQSPWVEWGCQQFPTSLQFPKLWWGHWWQTCTYSATCKYWFLFLQLQRFLQYCDACCS